MNENAQTITKEEGNRILFPLYSFKNCFLLQFHATHSLISHSIYQVLKIIFLTRALEKQKTETTTQRSFSHFLTFNIQMNRNYFLSLKHSCLRGQKKIENDVGILQCSSVFVST